MDGVAAELVESGFAQESVDKYLSLFEALKTQEDGISYLGEALKDVMEPGAAENLSEIVNSVRMTSTTPFEPEVRSDAGSRYVLLYRHDLRDRDCGPWLLCRRRRTLR